MKGIHATALASVMVAAALLVSSCVPMEEPRFTSDVERELARGRDYVAWVLSRSEGMESADAIGAGYLERLRLGLGSPFRLIEYALQDPRLDGATRERLAWSLLSATVDGLGYRVDPRAVAPTGDAAGAVRHLELVEGAILNSPDPDAGVLAVRLAYAMAEAEGSVAPGLVGRVAQAAALVRDRAVSRDDARRLLRAAGNDSDPLTLVTVWRVERRFVVESPAVLAVGSSLERDAINLAPRLLDGIRSIGERPRAGPLLPAPETRQTPVLSPMAAIMLAEESALYDYPPQTPVVVAVGAFRGRGDPTGTARDRFFANALNEERLAAEYALFYHSGSLDAAARLSVLSAAVSLRAYAQERPWFPGFGGPARRDLEDRFGLAAIEFPESVPAHWAPYYRRMLESALSDMERVVPSLDVRGLRVRIQPRDGSPGTLAVHDPRSRTMYLPPATGAGTIAHEIAHDLDWQLALRRYNVRGDYATDRAVRESDGRLARVMLGLTAASISPSAVKHPHEAHATRPAEVFARSVDWFTAVALAQQGRINGYLSSVQDDLLTGYGTVNPPDVTGAAGQSLVALLDEVAPVYPETRRWFLHSYGQLRAPSAFDLARRILEAPLDVDGEIDILASDWLGEMVEAGGRPDTGARSGGDPNAGLVIDEEGRPRAGHEGVGQGDVWADGEASVAVPVFTGPAMLRLATTLAQLERLESARNTLLSLLVGSCGTLTRQEGITAARRDLVWMVTGARARGLALEAAEELVGPEGRRWVAARLRDRNEKIDLEPAVVEALDSLVQAVRATTGSRVEAPRLTVPAAPVDCRVLPFAEG